MTAAQQQEAKPTRKKAADAQASKAPRTRGKDKGAEMLPHLENLVLLVRKVQRPELLRALMEGVTGEAHVPLRELTESAIGSLPIASRNALFALVANFDRSHQAKIERAAERINLLGDEYGTMAVSRLLDANNSQDAGISSDRTDKASKALYLFLAQEYPPEGIQSDQRFDHAETQHGMLAQAHSDKYSSHYIGPKGAQPDLTQDAEQAFRERLFELFPKINPSEILIEYFEQRDSSLPGNPIVLYSLKRSTRRWSTHRLTALVSSRSMVLERSSAPESKWTLMGKTLPPSDVTGFSVQRRVSDLLISWYELQDADLAGYEVRVGAGWDNGQLVAKTAGTQMVHDQSAAGLYPYHIRAYDTSGNYSAHVTTFVLSLQAPSTVRQFDVVQSANRLEFRWQPNPEPEVVGYELREGAAWDASLFVAEVKSTSYTLPSGFDGERKFWIKAIASPGIYSDTPTFVSTVVAQPQNANLILARDEQALGFPGTKHFASVVSVNGRNALRMSTGAQTAEYLFEVDLVSPIRAQNTLLNSLGASVDDRTTWLEANFPWSSDAARRQWAYDGAIANVDGLPGGQQGCR